MKRHQAQATAVFGFFGLFVFGASLRADVPLVEDGRPVAIVATADSADEHEKLAVQELLDHIEQISGAKLELSKIGADDGAQFVQQARKQKRTPVLIGRVAQPWLRQALQKKGGGRGTFALQAADGAVNEIGTGGLVAPVMLYAPAKGRDAQLENTRPLGETFP